LQQQDFERRWKQRFTQRGTLLDDDAGIAGWSTTGLAARVRQFQGFFTDSARKPGVWLDVGCGAGTYSRLLRAQGHQVVGLDYALPSLHKARLKAGNEEIAWSTADVQQLPIKDGSVDGILCFGVMQALAAPDRALAELARVLRPGGELWVDALNAGCGPTLVSEWRRNRRGHPPHLRYDQHRDFVTAVKRASLEVRSLNWLRILPGRLQGLQPVLEARPLAAALNVVTPVGSLLSHSFVLRAFKAGEAGVASGSVF